MFRGKMVTDVLVVSWRRSCDEEEAVGGREL